MKTKSLKQKVRQTLKTKLLILFLATFCLSLQSCGQEKEKKEAKPDYSNVDYSAPSNIIKNPAKLKGDEKAIFYHPFFLKLTYEEAKDLEPLKVKEEFAKLGITLKEDKRFGKAYSFYLTHYTAHKKSCENWEYFKGLAPNKN